MAGDISVVKALCSMCLRSCGMDVHVSGGRLLKITGTKEHPCHRLCMKGRAVADWMSSKERVTQPLRKVKGGWQAVSWPEAVRLISAALGRIRDSAGARALAVHLGNPFIGSHVPPVAKRFCSLYGTPNYTSSSSLCFAARAIGHGLGAGSRLLPLFSSYQGTRCIVAWGINPEQSDTTEAGNMLASRRADAGLIVIDPRRTPLAERADIFAQIRPGADAALALGLLNVIVSEGLYDEQFVHDWTTGFNELREHLRAYSPEVVAEMSWVPAATIRNIARRYVASRPACVAQGVSLDHCDSGVQASRAISILVAITGNLDIAGGNTGGMPLRLAGMRVKGRVNVGDAIGADYPVYGRFTGETTSVPLPQAILTGHPYPVRALVVHGSNPVLTWPNSGRVSSALKELELLVVSDLFLTETAALADFFLPAASFLEEDVLKDYSMVGLPLAAIGSKAIEPPGDCLEDWRLWAELGKGMGYAEYFPWRDSDELFADLLAPTGMTAAQIRDNPGGVWFGELGRRAYATGGFDTPSRRFEISSSILREAGYAPLPTCAGPPPDPPGTDEYPFLLVSGPRLMPYTHSRFRNVDRLRRRAPRPVAEVNAASAAALGIGDGDLIEVASARGRITLPAALSEGIHPGVVSITHGWPEANVNMLTDDVGDLDPVSGYPAFRTVACRIRSAGMMTG